MPRPKLADVLEENKRLRDETDVQHMALLFLGGGIEPDATERWTAKEHGYTDRVVVYLYGATRSDGGTIVEVQRPTGDSKLPTVRAVRLAEYVESCRKNAYGAPSAFNIARRDAADRLNARANEILRASLEAKAS